MDKIEEVLTRGVESVLPDKNSLAKLMATKKIRVYLGIDPTGPRLHIGHTIPMHKLEAFADLGHEAILVFGTGTVLAGDPSQRKEKRAQISEEEVEKNIADWKEQAAKIIDFEKVKIVKNGDWLLKLSVPELIRIESQLSAVQLFKRTIFTERLKRGDTVAYHETLYPVLQGYDSVHLDVDLEIGGTDQTFNMLVGRELQKKINNREKFILATPLISGTDGAQMTKSSGNCIWLDDSPDNMYGKVMSLADSQLEEYWTNLTNFPSSELKALKPFDAKKKLAFETVKTFHNESEAQKAQEDFQSTFQKGIAPQDLPEIKIKEPDIELVDFLAENNLVSSKSEAKRLLKEGAIEIDGQTISESEIKLQNNQVIRIGKKKFIRIVLSY